METLLWHPLYHGTIYYIDLSVIVHNDNMSLTAIRSTLKGQVYFGLIDLGGSAFTRFFIFTKAGVTCCVAAVKCRGRHHLSVVIFFCSFGINNSNTVNSEMDFYFFLAIMWCSSIKTYFHARY